MFNRRDLLAKASLAAVPASMGVLSHGEAIVVTPDPPTIIQWLEPIGKAENDRAIKQVEKWKADGMKSVLSLPSAARLVQFIGGRWVTVLPETAPKDEVAEFPGPYETDHLIIHPDNFRETVESQRKHGWMLKMAHEDHDVDGLMNLTFIRGYTWPNV